MNHISLALGIPFMGPDPSRARYNFSWIDADVLGFAYEKYLASVLKPASMAQQIDFFLPPQRDVDRVTVRKSAGAYYTPKYITNFLATKCIDNFYEGDKYAEIPRIIDFACGSGSFLVSAVDRLLHRLKGKDPQRPWAREIIDGGHIAGIDIDAKAVTAARLHLWQRLLEEPEALPLPNLSEVIRVGDGLDEETWGPLNRKYDVALGNPPFLSTSLVDSRDELRKRFRTAVGRFDLSSLFVEQALRILEWGGSYGFVVPNRLFRNTSGAPLRGLITKVSALDQIVDFGSTRPFDADAYVGCLVGHLKQEDEATPRSVAVIEVKSIEADFLAALLLEEHGPAATSENIVRRFVARHPRGEAPWRLLSDEEERLRISLEERSVLLDEIALVPQGIRTGANDIFLLEIVSEDAGDLALLYSDLTGEHLIETDLLRKAIYGSKLRRYDEVETDSRLIYPYRNNAPLPEAILREKYPHAWSYLTANRDLLAGRSSLERTGGRFFELIWPRNEEWLTKPKLMIRDLAPRTAFAADSKGEIFLVGGTAVVPTEGEMLYPLLGYLNSQPVNDLVRHTTPEFRSGFQKFEPKHIQRIPIVRRFLEDERVFGEIGFLAQSITALDPRHPAGRELEAKIDQIVVQLFSDADLVAH